MARDGTPSGNVGKGRKAGSRNKTTLEREAAALAAVGKPAADLVVLNSEDSRTLRLGKDIMSRAANYFFDKARRHAENGEAPDPKACEHNMKLAADIAAKVAGFESPRLSSVEVRRGTDLSKLTDQELDTLERLLDRATIYGTGPAGAPETQH